MQARDGVWERLRRMFCASNLIRVDVVSFVAEVVACDVPVGAMCAGRLDVGGLLAGLAQPPVSTMERSTSSSRWR